MHCAPSLATVPNPVKMYLVLQLRSLDAHMIVLGMGYHRWLHASNQIDVYNLFDSMCFLKRCGFVQSTPQIVSIPHFAK